jgi:energy-coupling factor transporter ATP-binding protein EcfA2
VRISSGFTRTNNVRANQTPPLHSLAARTASLKPAIQIPDRLQRKKAMASASKGVAFSNQEISREATALPRSARQIAAQALPSYRPGRKRLHTVPLLQSPTNLPLALYQRSVRFEHVPFSSRAISTSSSTPSNSLSSHHLLLALLLLTAIGLSLKSEASAQTISDGQMERLNALLEKKPILRTIDERIELFNTLLRKGMEEAEKAKGKDVVLVFGNMGSGKSTLIDAVYGCKMIDDNGKIIVDPKSPIKEVAPIGTEATACTSVPKSIPDVKLKVTEFSTVLDEFGQNERIPRVSEVALMLYDMPGLTDDRGIEVAMANGIVMQLIVKKARSVRFVMVFEQNQLNAERGDKWKEAVQLLEERFNGILGRGENSLCLVITQGNNDLDLITKHIKKYTPRNFVDLSGHATVYNPLDPNCRLALLDTIYKTRAYGGLDIKISMGDSQLLKALELGEQIQEEVKADLEKGNRSGVERAVRKIRFTYGIKELNSRGLTRPHEAAEKAVHETIKKVTDRIDPHSKPQLLNQIEAEKNYKYLKATFGPYVSFEESDRQVAIMKGDTLDPRTIAWNEPQASVGFAAGTVVLGVVACLVPPLGAIAAGLGAVGTLCCTGKAIWHWWSPSQEEKDKTVFFSGT